MGSIKHDLLLASIDFSHRGLKQSAKWCAEQAVNIPASPHLEIVDDYFSDVPPEEVPHLVFAKSLFDCKEFERAANFLEDCSSPKCYFLRLFSIYMSGERKKMESATDVLGPSDHPSEHTAHLHKLQTELCSQSDLDGYCLYLLGVVLKRLSLADAARQALARALNKLPLLWAAWLELSTLITEKPLLNTISLPVKHWMYDVFIASVYLLLYMNVEAINAISKVRDRLSHTPYILCLLGSAHSNLRDVDAAIECFSEARKIDPYRLEGMDGYSNVLFVKDSRVELASLAASLYNIDKYRVESCIAAGNLYSSRGNHDKAATCFERALRLSPSCLAAWTLLGHELVELKQTAAAIQAYRRAVDVCPADARAWYGLGQTYEFLRMHQFALTYFQRAHCLRPNDSRFLYALGICYEGLDRPADARRCFWRAYSVGDAEGNALLRFGRLLENVSESQAAAVYLRYISQAEERGVLDLSEQGAVYRFLATYYRKNERLDEAYDMAVKCAQYVDTKESGQALLRELAEARKDEQNSPNPAGDTIKTISFDSS